MKARPILFSAPMVRALLAGTKSQTRRLVKPQPVMERVESFGESWAWRKSAKRWFAGVTEAQLRAPFGLIASCPCPYGKPGDLLWVRETFASREGRDPGDWQSPLWFRADGETRSIQHGFTFFDDRGCWRPGIHMPRWASRITLRITDVRVQRLQDISEEDAMSEGAAFTCAQCGNDLDDEQGHEVHAACDEDEGSHRDGFRRIWQSINGTGSWDANPWVWCVSFITIKHNIDAVLAMADDLQGTESWRAERAGRITASMFSDAISAPEGEYKSGPRKGQPKQSEARNRLMRTLAFERTSGNPRHEIKSQSLNWGHELEAFSREAFELQTGLIVQPCGFIKHPRYDFIGASPDGLIGDDAGLEMKNPMDEPVHMLTWEKGMPEDHWDQVQGGLMVTGRKRWYFVSYDARAAERFRLYVQIIERDDAYINNVLLPGLLQFEADLQAYIRRLDRRAEEVEQLLRNAA